MSTSVTIRPVLNGWTVEVGCQTVVFDERAKLINELDQFLRDPDGARKRYLTEGVNRHQTMGPIPGGEPHQAQVLDKEYMKEAGRAIKAKLPDNHGFILLAAPYGPGGDGSQLFYISTMNREDAVKVLKEFLIHIK